MITKDGGVAVLLASVRGTILELPRRIRRSYKVNSLERSRRLCGAMGSAAKDENGNIARDQFAKVPLCPGLVMLRHCANWRTTERRCWHTVPRPCS